MNLSSRNLLVLLFFAFLIAGAHASAATTHEYELPTLRGVHSHLDKSFKLPIDLKSTFASITKVELYIEGTASPGSAIPLKGPKEEFQLPIEFHLSLTDQSELVGLKTPIALFGPLVGNFEVRSLFNPRPKKYSSDWSFLKKGVGELHFSWGNECSPDGCRYVNHSAVEITKAILEVTGELATPAAAIERSCKGMLASEKYEESAGAEHFIQQGCCGGVTGGCGFMRINRDGRVALIENGPWKKNEIVRYDQTLADRIFEIASTNGFFQETQAERGNLTCFIDYCSPHREHHISWMIDDNRLPKAILELLEEFRKLRK